MKEFGEGQCPFGFGAGTAAGDGAGGATHTAMTPSMSRDKLPELTKERIEPGQDGMPTGRCECGKVSFQVKKPVTMVFANHDVASRRRTGGISLTFMIRATSTVFCGWGNLVNWQANDREVHCFCRVCGTSVLVRYLAPERMDGMLSISAGALDSLDDMVLAADICADEKPSLYDFVGERRAITSTDLSAMFG